MQPRPDEAPVENSEGVEPLLEGSDIHEVLARATETQWSWRAAIEHWDQCAAAAAHKPHILALTRKAYCLIEVGQVDLARDVFTSFSDHFEGSKGLAVIAVLQGTMQHADALWDECLTRFPNHIAGSLGKAELLLRHEMYQDADKLLSRVVVTWPDSIHAGVLWAECATKAKDWEIAGTRWNSLLDKWPSERDVQQGYTRYLAALGDQAAVDQYLASLVEQPVALAACALEYHVANDDYLEAAHQAAKLAELEPQRLEHQLRLAGLLMRDGAELPLRAALSILKSLYQRSPESLSVITNLAAAYIRSGHDSQARNIIQTVPAVDRRAEVEILRAWLQHHDNNEGGAKATWDAILDRQYVPTIHAPIANLTRIDRNDIQIGRDDILLFSVVRNERPKLDWFLGYYRKLGINKFVIVDNMSTDQSAELLLQNPDVILYQTPDRCSGTGAGTRWVNELIDRYGRQNWCVYINADEALVFPGYERFGLRKLVDYLNWKGCEAMLAVTLDMYPATVDKSPQGDLETVQSSYRYFDDCYVVYGSPICPYREVFGGVRRRLFKDYQLANKVPLINGAAGVKFLLSSHRITPARLAGITGGLLNYHLLYALHPEYRPLSDEAIERRESPCNSRELLQLRELLSSDTSGTLLAEASVRFEGTEQLLALGKDQRIGLPQPDDYFLKFVRR